MPRRNCAMEEALLSPPALVDGPRKYQPATSQISASGALVQGLASELAPRIRVNAVAPTFMGKGTLFWKNVPINELEEAQTAFSQSVPLQRLGTVQEVASTYVHLMTNGFITGQVLAVDGGVMLRK
jgi:NAD(P)-dependent dehydrogenase (short-subunit alcohol dehydrogenase family)